MMHHETGQSKKVLLLVSHPKVFQAIEAALENAGCDSAVSFDEGIKADLVVMDSFYLYSGLADFVKKHSPESQTLLVLLPNERLECELDLGGGVDHLIALEPYHRHEDVFFLAVDWLRNACRLSFSKFSPEEFGTGLWVSLMHALPRIAQLQSR